ncbi:hypothetical protein AHAS_Ahas18G0083600 [Arachis hypogaea]
MRCLPHVPILHPPHPSDASSIHKPMLKSMLGCCKVYISESRNKTALESIEKAASLFPKAPIINKFEDVDYNRVGYTLVSEFEESEPSLSSSSSCQLTCAVLAMVKAAFDAIDFGLHSGTHPRLGVVDHICFHPLAGASLDQAATAARSLATKTGSTLQVPTFLYGAAHEEGRTLDSIRRTLGYFKPNANQNRWIGGPTSHTLPLNPNSGPAQVTPAKGVLIIGATNWVDNYNVPLLSSDISAVHRIAKLVSGRGGGLPSVQAMALAHGEGVIETSRKKKLFKNIWSCLRREIDVKQYQVEAVVKNHTHPPWSSIPLARNKVNKIKITLQFLLRVKDQKKTIDQSILLCCKIFVSEARNLATLDAIERVARLNPETIIVKKFPDLPYNRTRYTLVSYVLHDCTGNAIYSPLHQSVVAMAEVAFNAINLELHDGAHPRLGAVDDIVVHPLARASLDEAAWLAKTLAADIGNRFNVPVFLYGAAHPTGKELDTIRRELGYYRPNFMGIQWAGWAMPKILPQNPDEGPIVVSTSKGILMIGARPWVGLYNVTILSTDVSAARRIARKVSARGGGLPKVQTLGLVHDKDSTEIACMLLEPNQIGADRVQKHIEMLAAEEGLDVEKGYFTDLSPEMIIEKYMNLISANRS